MSLFGRKITLQVGTPNVTRPDIIKQTAKDFGISEAAAELALRGGESRSDLIKRTAEEYGLSEEAAERALEGGEASKRIGGRTFASNAAKSEASKKIGGRTFVGTSPAPVGTSEGKSWSDMEVSFRVKKTSDGKANEADIQIHNINVESIGMFQDPRAIVRLFAGYDIERLIFTGTAIKNGVGIERSGPDRILRIQAQDTRRKFARARLNIAFSTPTKLSQVLSQVSTDGDVPLGIIKLEEDIPFPNGVHLTGSIKQVMNQLAELSGVDWSMQDGAIQMIPPSAETGELAVVFSTKAGNLLSVERKDKGKIEMIGLLEGSMRPGGRYVIESESINGIFKAQEVEFTGSLFENAFFVKVLGRPSPTAGLSNQTIKETELVFGATATAVVGSK